MTNGKAIANLYGSFLTRDPGPALAVFNDDSIWIEPGDNLRSGTYRGLAEIVKHADHCKEMVDGNWGTDVLEMLPGNRYVVVVEKALALRNGTSLNMVVNTIYEMPNGIVTSFRSLPFDPDEWDAFWA
jgi:ketosteroid isomerase-like protein